MLTYELDDTKNAYGTHILYYFETLDITNFNYKKIPIFLLVHNKDKESSY